MITRPDILVLGGGGVLGRAWMSGLLSGIEDAAGFDLRRCEHFVGTSAGSVIGAQLAAGISPERPAETGGELATIEANGTAGPAATSAASAASAARRAGAWALAGWSPVAPLALELGRPGAALLRALALRAFADPDASGDHSVLRAEVDGYDTRFDGRLRISTVDRRSGRRVVFGAPGTPFATVGEAVEASCAIPGVYPPVLITGREYVDGGVWSPSNLDAAPAHRGTQVLCLNPLSTAGGSQTRPIRRGLISSALAVEALALRSRGAAVVTIAPDPASVTAMGSDLMDRRPRANVLAAGYQQGLALGAAERP
ncbi:MAG: patatin-like phospholipase family protein [Solirubrobacteraceae bacterium]